MSFLHELPSNANSGLLGINAVVPGTKKMIGASAWQSRPERLLAARPLADPACPKGHAASHATASSHCSLAMV